jgi:hypothetical protein
VVEHQGRREEGGGRQLGDQSDDRLGRGLQAALREVEQAHRGPGEAEGGKRPEAQAEPERSHRNRAADEEPADLQDPVAADQQGAGQERRGHHLQEEPRADLGDCPEAVPVEAEVDVAADGDRGRGRVPERPPPGLRAALGGRVPRGVGPRRRFRLASGPQGYAAPIERGAVMVGKQSHRGSPL